MRQLADCSLESIKALGGSDLRLTVPLGCLQFVIVVFPDHTHLLFFIGGPDVKL